jgi:hypothetical protein
MICRSSAPTSSTDADATGRPLACGRNRFSHFFRRIPQNTSRRAPLNLAVCVLQTCLFDENDRVQRHPMQLGNGCIAAKAERVSNSGSLLRSTSLR